ncbi:hypothetical protein D3C73_1655640 [compost metagenome]
MCRKLLSLRDTQPLVRMNGIKVKSVWSGKLITTVLKKCVSGSWNLQLLPMKS